MSKCLNGEGAKGSLIVCYIYVYGMSMSLYAETLRFRYIKLYIFTFVYIVSLIAYCEGGGLCLCNFFLFEFNKPHCCYIAKEFFVG